MASIDRTLPLNIEDLDFAGRRALVKAKGAQSKARRRGQAREACSHPATHAEAAARDRVGRPVDPDHPDRPETTEPWS
ncbi:hypothetical protein [Microtetraspora malaysiensis]|uniref:hypothetical protein n=1 Tax=Microtetraspora malaysiensis TaxID=161358 RepID=UPI00083142E9|nr:hypothetical protein [Microtetraspora malaysiensis]